MVTVDIAADLNDEDKTGYVWTFLDEAREPSLIRPGASSLLEMTMLRRSPRSWTSCRRRLGLSSTTGTTIGVQEPQRPARGSAV
jgi:hypothetical protein